MSSISGIQIENFKTLAKKSSEDARQYAYRVIKYCILVLLLSPGQKMNESDLADMLEVSRTPVHDTILRLSREHLADVFPRRGAFVARLDRQSIEQAVWTHRQMGISMIHSIYIRKTPDDQLAALYLPLSQLEISLRQEDHSRCSQLFMEYYHTLYLLAGDMELVWDAVHNTDADLRRLLYLAAQSSPMVVKGFLFELTDLTKALISRDNDKACQIFSEHMARMLMLLSPLQEQLPEYFTLHIAEDRGAYPAHLN